MNNIAGRINVDVRGEPQTLQGIKIYIVNDTPKMQLSARVCEVLAPDFIAETNAWMLEFFGTKNELDDGEVVMNADANSFIPASKCWMNPRTYEQFKQYVFQNGSVS